MRPNPRPPRIGFESKSPSTARNIHVEVSKEDGDRLIAEGYMIVPS